MTIDQILTSSYYEVFENNSDKIKKTYRELIKKYHPDVCSDERAASTIAKLHVLYKEAEEHCKNNTWKESNVLTLHRSDGKTALIKNFKYTSSNEMGRIWISNTCICYEFEKGKKKYFDNYLKMMDWIDYADENMEKHFSPFVPKVLDNFEADGNYYIIIKNYGELYPLGIVKDVFKTPEHAAWLTTKTLEICNFLQFNNIAHNGICEDNCFINFDMHTVHLFGGWQYSVPLDDSMIGVPKKVFDSMRSSTKKDKLSVTSTDLDAVKAMVKSVSDGRTYVKLLDNKFPTPFAEFLSSTSSEDAFEEYDKWEKARKASWEKRKFIKVEIPEDVWGK